MLKMPETEVSYWKTFHSKAKYPPLRVELNTDAVIVGGGIAGLTTAYLLKKSGLKVALLEKNTIGSGTTGGTTGKITSQHSLIYEDLSKRFGSEAARIYGEANQAALIKIAQIIKKEKIECDYESADNYVYTNQDKLVSKFKKEAATAAAFGLPASFVTDLGLPFPIKGAVKFAGQARFNVQKYLLGLAAAVHGSGSYVFENSNVISFKDGSPARIKTKEGQVTAKNIIVATKMPSAPLAARIACAIMEYPTTSYIVAGHYTGDLDGMYISPDKNHYSIFPFTDSKGKWLLIGGEKHIPGLGIPSKRHQKLAEYAARNFGIETIEYRWKAMDYLAYDDMPLIGKVYPWSDHMFTATAFHKWGLSTSMVAATILRDTIAGEENPWSSVFNSMRVKPIVSIPRAVVKYFG